jgi:hypothetical protein
VNNAIDDAGPDWGAEDQTTDLQAGPVEGDFRLVDATLEGAEGWPEPSPAPRRNPLEVARGTLIDSPGVAQRLAWRFDSAEQAAQAAAAFIGVDPSDLMPGSTGCFEAVPVLDKRSGRWQVVARYVEPPPSTVFPDFHTWVGEWLVAVIRRPLKSGAVWCPEWWRHPEAVARLDALWRAWESSRAEGGSGMSYWWTMHFDSHFSVLSDAARGPFAACKDQVHDGKLEALPCNAPPVDWSWPAAQEDS